jgi:ATP-dependent DNA helicase HFM1/MER3
VKLKKLVIGFEVSNEWVLNTRLDKELWPVLQKQSEGKPVLIFCPTRKGESAG